jgi:hypothetical protein
VVAIAFYALMAGIGLRRCWYGAVNTESGRVEARLAVLADDLSWELGFALASPHLLARLMERAQAVWYSAANRDRLAPLLPESTRQQLGSREFFAMALHARGVPSGLIYADPGDDAGTLDESRYNAFKQICAAAGQALERLST